MRVTLDERLFDVHAQFHSLRRIACNLLSPERID